MRPAVWLAGLLNVEGDDVSDEEVAAKLAAKLRLREPGGAEGRSVLVRFAQEADRLCHRPDELVRATVAGADANAAASDLGLRGRSELEQVIRFAARELWAWRASEGPPEPTAATARAASAAPAAGARAAASEPLDTPEARLEALAAAAIAEARATAAAKEAGQEAAEGVAAPAPAAPPIAAPPLAAVQPAVTAPAAPSTFAAQLAAAGPLIAFLAAVGAAAIVVLIIWLLGVAIGALGG